MILPIKTLVLFTITKTWKQPKCPLTMRIKMMSHIHTAEYYLVIIKDEVLPFATTWIDLESIMLSKIS